ncbi:hypothetical protein [Alteriqipengyuania sp. 357]
MSNISKISMACAVGVLAVSPAQAVELPRVGVPAEQAGYATQTVLNDGADEADHRRRYRYRRHRDRTDLGDVVAGAAIIGGIVAVLAATSPKKRDNRYDDGYDDRYDSSDASNDASDRAVDSCVERVEREERIGSIDNVGRNATGYSVTGTLAAGSGFVCQTSAAGRVLNVDYGVSSVSYQSGGDTYGDPQYSDDVYARARGRVYSSPATYSTPDSNAQPAYPGGPVPGEDYSGYEDYGQDYGDGSGADYGDGEPY